MRVNVKSGLSNQEDMNTAIHAAGSDDKSNRRRAIIVAAAEMRMPGNDRRLARKE
jgi:hypothetical protein